MYLLYLRLSQRVLGDYATCFFLFDQLVDYICLGSSLDEAGTGPVENGTKKESPMPRRLKTKVMTGG